MSLLRNISLDKLISLFLLSAVLVAISCKHLQPNQVLIRTEMGEITVEIDPEKAPVTASNFLSLVERNVYSNAFFYRVVKEDNQPLNKVKIEVIQGGLFEDDQINKHTSIIHEPTDVSGINHTDGVISMARNEPGTASTEFFICIGDQPSLDFGGERNPDGQGFSAFGKVIRGMEVVRAIQALPDSGQYLQNPVLIREIRVIE